MSSVFKLTDNGSRVRDALR